jgi:hypothetical protein
MSNKMIERLKAGPGPNTRIIRAMFAETFAFQYDDESGGLFGIDPGGFLMARDELKDLIEGANIFFDHYGDEAVKEHNEEKQAKHDAHEPEELAVRVPSKGWIYLLEGKDNLYKIGLTTRTPSKRLAEISPKMPFEPKLAYSFRSNDVYEAEEILHTTFCDRRVNGEWFQLQPADLD